MEQTLQKDQFLVHFGKHHIAFSNINAKMHTGAEMRQSTIQFKLWTCQILDIYKTPK